ncbi:hypothetical protein [Pedobacter sp.]|uniref:hypothetical protein n=1 Tax=Pedobacter sp. TaxID=1411316 RepID=UPI003D7FC769
MKNQSELIGLFEYKTKMLGDAIKRGELYDAIEAAGLVRDLLLSDNNGLLGAILQEIPELRNRRNRNIKFEVMFLGSTYHSNNDGYPLVAEAPNKTMICPHKEYSGVQSFNRNDFLALPILCTDYGHYSYKDLISFVANKLGSRHFDHKTGSEKQLILHEIRERFGLESFDPIITPILGLGSVVYTTCNKILNRLDELGLK